MIDVKTRKPLQVRASPGAEPYIAIPYERLEELRILFDANGILYEVDEETITMDDGPEIIYVNFNRRTDPAKVQRLLDEVP